MTTSTFVPPEVEEYIAAVRAALADLPSTERDDLLAEVEASLVETAGESRGPIAARLGPPDEFAAELRAAAGLHESTPSATPSRLALQARAAATRLAAQPAVARMRRLGSELAPIWWVARGYLAVGWIAYWFDTGWSTRYPMVPRLGSSETGLVAIMVVVVASVWLGLELRRQAPRLPRLVLLANVALLLGAIPVASAVTDTSSQDALVTAAYAPAPADPSGLAYDGVPVDNIYPYSRDGRLLHDVLLYDGAGRPIEIRGDRALDPDRRVVVASDDEPLFNAFPIRYFEPGTRRVASPNAAPPVELPVVLTPPLRATP